MLTPRTPHSTPRAAGGTPTGGTPEPGAPQGAAAEEEEERSAEVVLRTEAAKAEAQKEQGRAKARPLLLQARPLLLWQASS